MTNTTGQTQFYQIKGFNYGWICPICGKVYSPTYPECYSCNQRETEFSSTTIAMSDYEKAMREANKNENK